MRLAVLLQERLRTVTRRLKGLSPYKYRPLKRTFSLDPKEQLEAIKDMRKNGFVPLGNWHSHPESPSRPSEEDKRLAFDSKASYMILFAYGQRKPRSQFIQNYGRYSRKGRAYYRVKEGDYVRHRDYRQRPQDFQPQFMHSVKTLKRLWLKKNLWVQDRLPKARE